MNDTTIVCSKRVCTADDSEKPVRCGNPTCSRYYHLSCWMGPGGIGQKNDVRPIPPDNLISCTKACYVTIIRMKEKENEKEDTGDSTGPTLPWTKDGKNGPDDPMCSERILVDWLMEHGNYAKYRGTNNNGVKKIAFAEKISKLMERKGVKVPRSAKNIMSKISYIEQSFKKAYEWANGETGAGLLENDDRDGYENYIKKRLCAHYFDL